MCAVARAGTLNIVVNGVLLDNSMAKSVLIVPPSLTLQNLTNVDIRNTDAIFIGQFNATDRSMAFGGRVDNLRVYDDALTPSSCGDDSRASVGLSTLVAAYSFDAAPVSKTFRDESPFGNNGSIVSTANIVVAAGRFGSAIRINTGANYVNLGIPEALQLMGSQTFAAWCRPLQQPTNDGNLVARGDSMQFKLSPDIGGVDRLTMLVKNVSNNNLIGPYRYFLFLI